MFVKWSMGMRNFTSSFVFVMENCQEPNSSVAALNLPAFLHS
jgi:hypothetical protein